MSSHPSTSSGKFGRSNVGGEGNMGIFGCAFLGVSGAPFVGFVGFCVVDCGGGLLTEIFLLMVTFEESMGPVFVTKSLCAFCVEISVLVSKDFSKIFLLLGLV